MKFCKKCNRRIDKPGFKQKFCSETCKAESQRTLLSIPNNCNHCKTPTLSEGKRFRMVNVGWDLGSKDDEVICMTCGKRIKCISKTRKYSREKN